MQTVDGKHHLAETSQVLHDGTWKTKLRAEKLHDRSALVRMRIVAGSRVKTCSCVSIICYNLPETLPYRVKYVNKWLLFEVLCWTQGEVWTRVPRIWVSTWRWVWFGANSGVLASAMLTWSSGQAAENSAQHRHLRFSSVNNPDYSECL